MKIFSKALKDQAIKVIHYEKKEMISSADEEKETQENQKICYICGKNFARMKIIKKNFN